MNIALQLVIIFSLTTQHISCFRAGSKKTVNLYQNSAQEVQVYTDNFATDYIIVQAHSQYQNNTLSKQSYPYYGASYQSTHSGIVRYVPSYQRYFDMYVSGSSSEGYMNAMLLAVPIQYQQPIPGGCCLTCALENDPNLSITYDELKTSVSFSRASKYHDSSSAPDCDGSDNPATMDLVYHIYYMYIDANDYTENTLFDSLSSMSTPDTIKSNGVLLTTLSSTDALAVDVETVFAQGVIFNVIVSDGDWPETAYVPTAVYACNFTAPDDAKDNCHAKGSITVLVFTIIFGTIGLLVCVAGFKYFRLLVFVTSTEFYWFILFVVLCRFTDSQKISQEANFIIAFMISLIGGGITLLMYAFDKLFYLVFVKICIVFGMFLSAIVFYTPFGYFEVWNEDYRFILGFVSIALVIAMIGLFVPKATVYFGSSLIGSYAIILVPNYFLRSNMQYIVMTIVNRLVVPKFGYLYLRRPFDHMEKILAGCWAGVLLLGMIIQYLTTKNQEFHYSGKRLRHRVWDRLSQSVNLGRRGSDRNRRLRRPVNSREYQRSPPPEETAPLLNNLEESEEHSANRFSGSYGGLGQTNRSFEDDFTTSAAVAAATAQIHHSPPTAPPVQEDQPLLRQSPTLPSYEYSNGHHQNVPPPAYESIAGGNTTDNERQPLLQRNNERYPARMV